MLTQSSLISNTLGGQSVVININNRPSAPSCTLGYSGVAVYPALIHPFDVLPGQICVITENLSNITYYPGWKAAAVAVGLEENKYLRISRLQLTYGLQETKRSLLTLLMAHLFHPPTAY